MKVTSLLGLLFLALSGCAHDNSPDAVWRKVAMTHGMRIDAQTNNGPLTIIAGSGTTRTFIFEYAGKTVSRTLTLGKRDKEWDGITGIYAGSAYSPFGRSDGDAFQILVQDGQVNRADSEECNAYMNYKRRSDFAPMPWVYNDSGLAVSFEPIAGQNQVVIDIVQFYVNGEKPKSLRASTNDAIKVSYEKK